MQNNSRLFPPALPARRFDFWIAGQARPARGFTLLEILVALAVLAIALSAAIRSIGQAVDSSGALRDRMLAQWLAEDRLVKHQLSSAWPAIDTVEGESEYAGRTWRWREQVAATPVEKLRRVDLIVMLPGSNDPAAHVTAFLKQP